VGCSDNSESLVPTNEQTNSSVSLAKMGEDLHSVTGTGHWKSVPFGTQTQVRISYSAIRHRDGTVSGEVQDKDKGPMFNFHGKVTDLKVEGNIAKIEFMFTSGTYLGVPLADYYGGDLSAVRAWLVAIDNGEGIHATSPDVSSGILWGDDAELEYFLGKDVEYISNLGAVEFINYMTTEVLPTLGIPPEAYLTPVDNGSVQVR
jgi:hypothetical protein